MDTKETNLELLSQCRARINAVMLVLRSVQRNTDTTNLNSFLDASMKNMENEATRIINVLTNRNAG